MSKRKQPESPILHSDDDDDMFEERPAKRAKLPSQSYSLDLGSSNREQTAAASSSSSTSNNNQQQQQQQQSIDFIDENSDDEEEVDEPLSNSQVQQDFFTILREGGLKLPPMSSKKFEPLKLDNPMRLRKHLENTLSREPQRIQEFEHGFNNYIKNELNLKRLLYPYSGANSQFLTSSNESVCKIFLNVEALQTNIALVLLEKMSTIADTLGEQAEFFKLEDNIPRMILSQFRWLDTIKNCKKIADRLIDVLEHCPPYFNKEIITAIPEIIVDSEHVYVAEKLQQYMNTDQQYTICTLDALSNLNLQNNRDIRDDLRNFVLSQISSSEIDSLPVIIRYLIQSADDEHAEEIAQQIRQELDLTQIENQEDGDHDFGQSLLSQRKKKKSVVKNAIRGESLVLEALRTGIRYKKVIEKSFIKVIDAANDSKVLDIWILMVIFSMDNYAEDALKLFRRKIKQSAYTTDLLERSITNYQHILEDLFSSMAKLAGTLLRGSDLPVSKFGQSLYYYLFKSFDSAYNSQEIIRLLVTHIGSGSKSEVDAALEVLLHLSAGECLLKLRKYSGFFQSMLDYLENMKTDQLRKIYKVFCTLAFVKRLDNTTPPDHANIKTIRDELLIIIRKQLSHVNIKYRKMGIIAASSLLSTIGSVAQSSLLVRTRGHSQVLELSEEEYTIAQEVLHQTKSSCSKSAIFNFFFCDELTSAIAGNVSLDLRLVQELQAFCIDTLDHFFKNSDDSQVELNSNVSHMIAEKWMGMGDHLEKFLDFTTPIIRDDTHYYEQIWNAFASLRLYCAISDLDQVSHTLLYPVLVFREEEMRAKFKSLSAKYKQIACLSLFCAMNWFRETINVFTLSRSPLDRAYAINRIEHVIHIEGFLDYLICQYPEFSVPQINYYLLPLNHVTTKQMKPSSLTGKSKLTTTAPKQKKKATKKKTKKKAKGSDEEPETSSSEQEDEPTVTEKAYVSSVDNKNLARFRRNMRELDLSVIDIIGTQPFVSQHDETVELKPMCLYFLLQDLVEKIKIILVSKANLFLSKSDTSTVESAASRISCETFLERLIPILPQFREHLTLLINRLSSPEEPSSSSSIGGGSQEPESENESNDGKYISPCLQLLCSIMTKVICFYKQDHRSLERVLIAFNKKLNSTVMEDDEEDDLLENDIAKDSFHFFADAIKKVNAPENVARIFEVLCALVIVFPKNKTLQHNLASVARFTLHERGQCKLSNDLISKLIKAVVVYSENGSIEEIKTFISSLEEFKEDDNPETGIPTLNRNTYIVYFKSISTELKTLFSRIDKRALTDDRPKAIESLKHITECTEKMFICVYGFNKNKMSVPLVSAAMNFAKRFLSDFLKMITVLTKWWKMNKTKIHALIEKFRDVVTKITSLTYWEKVENTAKLAKLVPQVRKDTEACFLRIKTMYAKHGANWTVKEVQPVSASGQKLATKYPQNNLSDDEEDEDYKVVSKKKGKKTASKKTSKSVESSDDEENPPEPKQKKRSTTKAPKNKMVSDDEEEEKEERVKKTTQNKKKATQKKTQSTATTTTTTSKTNKKKSPEKKIVQELSEEEDLLPVTTTKKKTAQQKTQKVKKPAVVTEVIDDDDEEEVVFKETKSRLKKNNSRTKKQVPSSKRKRTVVEESEEEDYGSEEELIRARGDSEALQSDAEDDEDGDLLTDYISRNREEEDEDDYEDLQGFIVQSADEGEEEEEEENDEEEEEGGTVRSLDDDEDSAFDFTHSAI